MGWVLTNPSQSQKISQAKDRGSRSGVANGQGVVATVIIGDDSNDVVAILAVATFTRVALVIVVRAAPLEENPVTNVDVEVVGNVVILQAVTDLSNVATLSTNVDVPDSCTLWHNCWKSRSLFDLEDIGAVLESTTILGSVDSHANRNSLSSVINNGSATWRWGWAGVNRNTVLFNWVGGDTAIVEVVELPQGLSSGHVVTKTNGASHGIGGSGGGQTLLGEESIGDSVQVGNKTGRDVPVIVGQVRSGRG